MKKEFNAEVLKKKKSYLAAQHVGFDGLRRIYTL